MFTSYLNDMYMGGQNRVNIKLKIFVWIYLRNEFINVNNQVNIDHARVSSAPTLNTEYHLPTTWLGRIVPCLPWPNYLGFYQQAPSGASNVQSTNTFIDVQVMQYDTMNQVYYQIKYLFTNILFT